MAVNRSFFSRLLGFSWNLYNVFSSRISSVLLSRLSHTPSRTVSLFIAHILRIQPPISYDHFQDFKHADVNSSSPVLGNPRCRCWFLCWVSFFCTLAKDKQIFRKIWIIGSIFFFIKLFIFQACIERIVYNVCLTPCNFTDCKCLFEKLNIMDTLENPPYFILFILMTDNLLKYLLFSYFLNLVCRICVCIYIYDSKICFLYKIYWF